MNFKKSFLAIVVISMFSCEHNTNHRPITTVEPVPTSTSVQIVRELPNEFKMTEDLVSIGADFHIEDSDGNIVGVVEERTFNLTKTFDYFDNTGTLKAKAKKSMFSWGVEICVYDSIGNVLGYIKEEVFENIFSIKTTYSIFDANKNKIATSKKLDFIGTDIDIYCNNELTIAMSRPAMNFLTDSWSINMNNNSIDKRIVVFIPAYKTSADNDRRDEEDSEDNK